MHADPEQAASGFWCWVVAGLMLLVVAGFVAWLANAAG
jgi:hypothetical protein